jgi:hypothetical protein
MLAVFIVSMVFGIILAVANGTWVWFLLVALALVFTPLLFPTGRLLSRPIPARST